MRNEALSVRNLTYHSQTERVLSNISFDLYRGEVLGIVGVNGVGKSILAKILAGVTKPDTGRILLDGEELDLQSPVDAIRKKIGYVGEQPSFLPSLTVAENLVIGLDDRPCMYYSRRKLYENADRILQRYGFTVSARAVVESLAYSQIKEVQIARQLANQPRVLVFDELADSFSGIHLDNLQKIFKMATAEGIAIIYTTHNDEDIVRFADRILVLRSTSIVADLPRERFERTWIRQAMYGGETVPADAPAVEREAALSPGPEVFALRGLCAEGLSPLSLSVRQGEILGISGLVGSGKSCIAQCVGGQLDYGGAIEVDGTVRRIRSPWDAVQNQIGVYFEKRNEMLLSAHDPIFMNLSMGVIDRIGKWGVLSRRRELLLAEEYRRQFDMSNPVFQEIGQLNNSVLTKIALARCMAANPRILILDEPNRELDTEGVATLAAILESLRAVCGIVLILSKIDTLAACCDRTLIMHEGRMIGELGKGRLSYVAMMRLVEDEGSASP